MPDAAHELAAPPVSFGVTRMRPEHASQVAEIHRTVLPESIYSALGAPFLEYYYRRLLQNDNFMCHVYLIEDAVVGFLSSTTSSQHIFWRQIRRDWRALAAALWRTIAADPRTLGVLLKAAGFLISGRRAMLPGVEGEILSFAVRPDYRGGKGAPDGVSVAAQLFAAATGELMARGAREIKIMTAASNAASNRFYQKMGCTLRPETFSVFGHRTHLYYKALSA